MILINIELSGIKVKVNNDGLTLYVKLDKLNSALIKRFIVPAASCLNSLVGENVILNCCVVGLYLVTGLDKSGHERASEADMNGLAADNCGSFLTVLTHNEYCALGCFLNYRLFLDYSLFLDYGFFLFNCNELLVLNNGLLVNCGNLLLGLFLCYIFNNRLFLCFSRCFLFNDGSFFLSGCFRSGSYLNLGNLIGSGLCCSILLKDEEVYCYCNSCNED